MISFSQLGRFGRLGNQMFQYACAFAIAKKNNTQVSISTHEAYRESTINQLVETFEISSAVFNCYDGIEHVFYETGYGYDARIKSVLDNTDLRGYFQSELYFKHLRSELLESEFVFKPNILHNAKSIFDMTSSPRCSIHVRRGDFKNFVDVHPNLGEEYYKKALSLIPECSTYFVFSDEIDEAKSILDPIISDIRAKFVFHELDYATSMCAMSMCDHHIIANSSFSWWGSWLSSRIGTTVAPRKWVGPAGPKSWNSIYCKKWIVI